MSECSLEDKAEALELLLSKALKAVAEVEARIPYYLNAKTYASRLRRMIESALKISREICGDVKKRQSK